MVSSNPRQWKCTQAELHYFTSSPALCSLDSKADGCTDQGLGLCRARMKYEWSIKKEQGKWWFNNYSLNNYSDG